MKNKILIQKVDSSNVATLYTITFENCNISEFNKFINRFKDNGKLQRDYQLILVALQKILQNGVLERYFRPEGKFNDRVCALPISSGKLRLYCLRISDKILILGNGGLKETKTYNESSELNGYVLDLQKFDAILKQAEEDGTVIIKEAEILVNEDKNITL